MTSPPSAVIRRRVWVSGRVQGVSFRAATFAEAQRHISASEGLRGFVRNLSDGRVEAVFQGEVKAVEAMVAWCSHGPLLAQVTAFEVKEESVDDLLPVFQVLR